MNPKTIKIKTMNPKTIKIYRIVFCVLFVLWIIGGIYLYSSIKGDKQMIQRRKAEISKQQERMRRQVAYEQRLMEEQTVRDGTQNAVDSFSTKGE